LTAPPRRSSIGAGGIVAVAASARLAAKRLKQGTLKVYQGLPRGMCTTHAEAIDPDLLAFIKSRSHGSNFFSPGREPVPAPPRLRP
jgi:hypothetical protein